jgi:hypothetical protein
LTLAENKSILSAVCVKWYVLYNHKGVLSIYINKFLNTAKSIFVQVSGCMHYGQVCSVIVYIIEFMTLPEIHIMTYLSAILQSIFEIYIKQSATLKASIRPEYYTRRFNFSRCAVISPLRRATDICLWQMSQLLARSKLTSW